MEGQLKKWTNFLIRWKSMYFRIENDILLSFYKKKGGKKQGQIHIQVASIYLIDQESFRITQGNYDLRLKAENENQKNKWIQCFQNANENIIKTSNFKEEDQIKEQVQIDQALSQVQIQINNLKDSNQLLEKRVKSIVQKVQQKTSKLEKELVELQEISIIQKQLIKTLDQKYKRIQEKLKQFDQQIEDDDQQDNSYHSINEDEIKINTNSFISIYDNIQKPIKQLKLRCPIKQNIIDNNKVFQSTQISQLNKRLELPFKKDPNLKVNIWQIIKGSVGKDLSQITVPIFLNEPLSMLQKQAEQMKYYNLLNIANQQKCSLMRMAYVMAFSFSCPSLVINRTLKPFNPILGETFEMLSDDLKFLSEQVSHHPPISAFSCFNDNFKMWSNSDIITKFWGKSLEINPNAYKHIILNKNKDHIVFQNPKTGVYNLIFGKLYVDFMGDQIHKNQTTGEIGVITYSLRGWRDKNAYEGNGYIADSQGNKKYILKGKWNSRLDLINLETNETIKLWEKEEVPEQNSEYYYMSDWTMNLNHLNTDLINKIPATDSRLRPDQRALEYGDINLASEEKNRLEQKQRQKKKENQKNKIQHKPKWFIEKKCQITNKIEYESTDEYWEYREKNDFGNTLDLF